MILAAWRGQTRETRELVELTKQEARSRGEGVALAICDYARAVLCNGLREYDEDAWLPDRPAHSRRSSSRTGV